MAEDATYTEYRADIAGLRDRPTGALKSGNFEYPVYPFRPPPELTENRIGHHRVVIVGGGLAGLTAAADLGMRGIACVLLDDNNTVSLGSRSIAGVTTSSSWLRKERVSSQKPKGSARRIDIGPSW